MYVRFDATVNGNGGGGPGNGGADSAVTDTSTGHPVAVSYDTTTTTNAANRDYAQPVYAALDGPFTQVTNGFVGTASDGLSAARRRPHAGDDLRRSGRRQRCPDRAARPGRRPVAGKAVLTLGFGATQAEAVKRRRGVARRLRSSQVLAGYEAGWLRYDLALRPPPLKLPGVTVAPVA